MLWPQRNAEGSILEEEGNGSYVVVVGKVKVDALEKAEDEMTNTRERRWGEDLKW